MSTVRLLTSNTDFNALTDDDNIVAVTVDPDTTCVTENETYLVYLNTEGVPCIICDYGIEHRLLNSSDTFMLVKPEQSK